eukprot:5964159-Pleurochrysis_carterae.AAC.6
MSSTGVAVSVPSYARACDPPLDPSICRWLSSEHLSMAQFRASVDGVAGVHVFDCSGVARALAPSSMSAPVSVRAAHRSCLNACIINSDRSSVAEPAAISMETCTELDESGGNGGTAGDGVAGGACGGAEEFDGGDVGEGAHGDGETGSDGNGGGLDGGDGGNDDDGDDGGGGAVVASSGASVFAKIVDVCAAARATFESGTAISRCSGTDTTIPCPGVSKVRIAA